MGSDAGLMAHHATAACLPLVQWPQHLSFPDGLPWQRHRLSQAAACSMKTTR